jgi:hypothetical protein
MRDILNHYKSNNCLEESNLIKNVYDNSIKMDFEYIKKYVSDFMDIWEKKQKTI